MITLTTVCGAHNNVSPRVFVTPPGRERRQFRASIHGWPTLRFSGIGATAGATISYGAATACATTSYDAATACATTSYGAATACATNSYGAETIEETISHSRTTQRLVDRSEKMVCEVPRPVYIAENGHGEANACIPCARRACIMTVACKVACMLK